MAIDSQKFLPRSESIVKDTTTFFNKSSSVVISKTSQKNIVTIRVKVIQIEKILKGTLALQKKELDNKKKVDSSRRREKIEEKLETKPKPKAESGKIKMPSLPRMGFLDWVKNFIGNVILGYFAVRLVDHLPKIIPIVKFLGKATDFVLNLGGKLLDGLVTFIDWGYKAYDATRGFVKNLFGEDGAKQFDQLSGLLNQFLNLAIIAGMATAGAGGLGGKGGRGGGAAGASVRPRPRQSGKPRVTTSGGGRAGGIDIRNPLRQRPKVTIGRGGNRTLLSSVRPFLKKIPLPVVGALIDFGLSVALGENPGRAAFRAIGAGILGTIGGGLAGVLGLAGGPLAVATAALGSIAGGTLGDMAGGALYDLFFGGKKPSGKSRKYAGGGTTRAGRPQRGVSRTIRKRGRYRRKLAPQKPGDVEATSPGADVGGGDKLFGESGLFPNPLKFLQKATDAMNPFKVIQKAGQNLGESDYFGPILAITSKILLGQKPTQQDYKNVGLGINMLVAKGIDDGKLKGGLVAFAEGGFVDPKTLDAIAQGGDISDWVARSFKNATETNTQKTLREIQENLRLKKTETTETPPSPEIDIESAGTSGGGTSDTSLNPYRRAFLDTLAYAEGTANYPNTGYNTMFTGKQFSGFRDHPRKIQRSSGYASDAAGRYQFLSTTWDGLGLPDFSPANQDKGALKLLSPHVLAAIDKGDFATAFHGARKTWASLPGAGYGQPEKKMKTLVGYANARLVKYQKGEIGKPVKDTYEGLSGSAGTIGGTGKFIQGNSGNSRGVHFHIGPGSQVKGTILQSKYNADARATAAKVVDYFLKRGSSVYDGRRGTYYKSGKEVAAAQRAHSASGSQGGIDLQVDFEKPVPFPLNVTGMAYRPNGFGVSADIAGSNSFVAHGRYDEKGRKAPQTGGLIAYEKGGKTLEGPHMAMLGEKGREFVIDADSTKAIEGTFPGFLDAINKAKYSDAIKVLSNFAPYESGARQTIVMSEIQMGDQTQDYDSSSSSGFFMGGGEEESDPFDILYQGG